MPLAVSEGHTSKRKKMRNDLILIVALLAVVGVAALVFALTRTPGDRAVVTVDGDIYGSYPLSRDTEVDILTGEDQGQLNRLIIKNGEAFVVTATCPDGICAAHKPISYDGESIICLPHKVVITVAENTAERS